MIIHPIQTHNSWLQKNLLQSIVSVSKIFPVALMVFWIRCRSYQRKRPIKPMLKRENSSVGEKISLVWISKQSLMFLTDFWMYPLLTEEHHQRALHLKPVICMQDWKLLFWRKGLHCSATMHNSICQLWPHHILMSNPEAFMIATSIIHKLVPH